MRERIYHILEKSDGSDKLSQTYDIFMIVVILVSLIPLAFKTENLLFIIIDKNRSGKQKEEETDENM